MKMIHSVMIISLSLLLTNFITHAQNTTSIQPQHLAIAYTKTTNIIFPYAIKSIDRGSKEVLAQKAGGVENILQLKAGNKDFEETNLTVITADGELHSFILNYSNDPSILNFTIGKTAYDQVTVQFSPENRNEVEIATYAAVVANAPYKNKTIIDRKFGISFQLIGLFIKEDVMYFRIKLENRSNINYDVDQLRFFIRDRKKSKRTATQEVEIVPLHINNMVITVAGQSEHTLVYALPKFTIPDKKHLVVQLMEKNGGRH